MFQMRFILPFFFASFLAVSHSNKIFEEMKGIIDLEEYNDFTCSQESKLPENFLPINIQSK